MENNILIVVDMQKDFINGSLGTKEAQDIVKNVKNKIDNFKGKIFFTKDTHDKNYLNSQEGKKLPIKHCIKGTSGHEIDESLDTKNAEIIEKPGFGSVELVKRLEQLNEQVPIDSITLVGICTDICVVSNAITIKTFLPEVPIIVDSSCCAGVTKESHQKALDTMKSCQIEIV